MRAYIPNHKEEYIYPDQMEKILSYLNANGKILISGHMVESLYEDYSDEVWCAQWMSVNDEILEDFAEWLSKVEVD
jgi:hypothetical protein